MNIFRFSYFGLIVFFSFLVLSLVSRILFPFADEPDWTIRAPRVLFGEHYVWSPYYFLSDLWNQLNINGSTCRPEANALSIWAEIPSSCVEGLSQILIRFSMTLFIVSPIMIIAVFRRSFMRIMHLLNLRLSNEEWNHRIDSLALTMIFPSALYYLGVLAEEQLFLVVALYVFLFWGFWIPVVTLFIVLISIDFGNSIVVVFFILSLFFFSKVHEVNRRVFFIFLVFLLFFFFFIGYRFLEFFSQFSFLGDGFTSKSDAMYQSLNGSELVNKYPVILRPIITFMTFVFMTPSGVKVPILYVIVGFFTFFISLKILKRNDKVLDCYWFISIFSIISLVFLFPTYANAKYYIFMMPFFVYVVLSFCTRRNVLLFFIFSSFCVFLHLILYRI
jgi:hypothetical protein